MKFIQLSTLTILARVTLVFVGQALCSGAYIIGSFYGYFIRLEDGLVGYRENHRLHILYLNSLSDLISQRDAVVIDLSIVNDVMEVFTIVVVRVHRLNTHGHCIKLYNNQLFDFDYLSNFALTSLEFILHRLRYVC